MILYNCRISNHDKCQGYIYFTVVVESPGGSMRNSRTGTEYCSCNCECHKEKK